jgi:hypothetical protein
LASRLEKRALLWVVALIAGSFLLYIMLHLPFKNEYKFLLLSTVMLGVVGGIGFGVMLERHNRLLVCAILIFFLLPTFMIIKVRSTHARKDQYAYSEEGIELHTIYSDDQELYDWIKANTPKNAIFVDEKLGIPVLAQRALLIPTNKARGQRHVRGYGPLDLILSLMTGYDQDALQRRSEIIENIYDPSTRLTEEDLKELSSLPGPVYVILRSHALKRKFDTEFEEVFTTSRNTLRVYSLRL